MPASLLDGLRSGRTGRRALGYRAAVSEIVTEPDDITAEWLSAVLEQPITGVVRRTRIGTGQMSRNYRVEFDTADGPAASSAVVIKIPTDDPTLRAMAGGSYSREVGFYARLADRVDCARPVCLHHEISAEGNDFVLVLSDLAPATQGDQIAGCSIDDAHRAIENLAGLHAPVWNDASLHEVDVLSFSDLDLLGTVYRMAHDQFVERYGDRLAPTTGDALLPLRDGLIAWLTAPSDPFSLVHGDYRLDNLLFSDAAVAAVDWQTVAVGPPARDVAYFVGNGITIDERRRHEDELLLGYLDALGARGITDYPLDRLRTDYARGAWLGAYTTVLGAFAAARTDRGDDMFVVMADRAAAQILDHESVGHLP